MIREATNVINSSKLIIEDKFKFFITVLNFQVPKTIYFTKNTKVGNSMKTIVTNINTPTLNFIEH